MEEKERYIVLSGRQIKDTTNNSQYFLGIETICKMLNQQDKKIKELETIIFEKPSKKRINFDKWKELYLESQQLKQELKDERAELQQLYSHLEVEAFGEDIQEQAVKEIDKIKEENQQLKQQLHDLPKKIVEEIKNNCWYCGALLEDDYYKVTDKLLDTILKKFGGENESNND